MKSLVNTPAVLTPSFSKWHDAAKYSRLNPSTVLPPQPWFITRLRKSQHKALAAHLNTTVAPVKPGIRATVEVKVEDIPAIRKQPAAWPEYRHADGTLNTRFIPVIADLSSDDPKAKEVLVYKKEVALGADTIATINRHLEGSVRTFAKPDVEVLKSLELGKTTVSRWFTYPNKRNPLEAEVKAYIADKQAKEQAMAQLKKAKGSAKRKSHNRLSRLLNSL